MDLEKRIRYLEAKRPRGQNIVFRIRYVETVMEGGESRREIPIPATYDNDPDWEVISVDGNRYFVAYPKGEEGGFDFDDE